jgi:hypothetical protein
VLITGRPDPAHGERDPPAQGDLVPAGPGPPATTRTGHVLAGTVGGRGLDGGAAGSRVTPQAATGKEISVAELALALGRCKQVADGLLRVIKTKAACALGR